MGKTGLKSIETSFSDVEEQQFAPRRLALLGDLVCHAALVIRPDQTIVLTGPSGIGKSTLSAALRSYGWALLGDDTMVVSTGIGRPIARVLFPRLRLKPDAASAVGGGDAMDMGIDSAGKHVYNLSEAYKPKPLSAVFLLAAASEDFVSIDRCRPSDACLAIVANSFANDPNDVEEASKRFRLAANVASLVPVFRLSYPRDFNVIPRVAAAISNTLDSISVGEEL